MKRSLSLLQFSLSLSLWLSLTTAAFANDLGSAGVERVGFLGFVSAKSDATATFSYAAYQGIPQINIHFTDQPEGSAWGTYSRVYRGAFVGAHILQDAFTLDARGYVHARAESGAEAICGRFHRDAGQWISSLGDHDYWEAKTFHPTGNCLVKLEDITGRDSSVESGKRTYEAYLEILP